MSKKPHDDKAHRRDSFPEEDRMDEVYFKENNESDQNSASDTEAQNATMKPHKPMKPRMPRVAAFDDPHRRMTRELMREIIEKNGAVPVIPLQWNTEELSWPRKMKNWITAALGRRKETTYFFFRKPYSWTSLGAKHPGSSPLLPARHPKSPPNDLDMDYSDDCSGDEDEGDMSEVELEIDIMIRNSSASEDDKKRSAFIAAESSPVELTTTNLQKYKDTMWFFVYCTAIFSVFWLAFFGSYFVIGDSVAGNMLTEYFLLFTIYNFVLSLIPWVCAIIRHKFGYKGTFYREQQFVLHWFYNIASLIIALIATSYLVLHTADIEKKLYSGFRNKGNSSDIAPFLLKTQLAQKCCGVKSYKDYFNKTKINDTNFEGPYEEDLLYPPSCCKASEKYCTSAKVHSSGCLTPERNLLYTMNGITVGVSWAAFVVCALMYISVTPLWYFEFPIYNYNRSPFEHWHPAK